MKAVSLLPRILALFLSLCLALPSSPALALRQMNVRDNAGLEEEVARALGRSATGLEEGEVEADPIQERLDHRGDYNKGESWWWWDYESEVSPLPEIPEAGYKLYVTGEPEEAGELIDLVLPFLRGRRIPHKVMKSAHLLRLSRSPEAPDNLKKEEGKFIVVYPPLPVGEKGRMSELARELNPDGFVLSEASIQTAAKLAMALDDLLAEANFPQRPKPISLVMSLPEGRSGRLFVRYGSFTGDSYYGPHPGFPGEVVVYEDIRDRSNAFPQWLGSEAEDPFLRAVTQEKAAPGYRGDTLRDGAGLEEVVEAWEDVTATPAYAGVEKGILPVLLPGAHRVAPLLAKADKFFVALVNSQGGLEELQAVLHAVGADPRRYHVRVIEKGILSAVLAIERDFPNAHLYLVTADRIFELLAGLEEEGIIPVGDYTRASQVTERHLAGQL